MVDAYSSQTQAQSQSGPQRMRRPRCPQCGSRRYRRDPDTLLVVCALGHVLQGYREEQADDGEEFEASQGSQRRRRRLHKDPSQRKRGKRYKSRRAEGIWYGEQSRTLYLRCLQLLLRMQLQALRRELNGIPTELESVCRELWTLYMSLQPDVNVPSTDQESQNGTSTPAELSSVRAASLQRSVMADQQALLEEEENESDRFDEELRSMGLRGADDDHDDDEGVTSAWTGSDTDGDMRTDGDGDSDGDNDHASSTGRKRQRARGFPRKAGTFSYRLRSGDSRGGRKPLTTLLGIIYLGLLTLHVPLLWTDIQALVLSERVPYLNAVYRLPREMIRPLSYQHMFKLNGQIVPSVAQMQRRVIELARDLTEAFGARFPELNSLPLLARCCEGMLLPPTVYRAAKRLLAYAEVPLHPVLDVSAASVFPAQIDEHQADASAGLRRRSRAKSAGLKQPQLDKRLAVSLNAKSVAREVILMAAVVMMAKMRYGLDGEERFECPDDADVWAGAPSMHVWLSALSAHNEGRQMEVVCAADPSSIAVLDMKEPQLDAYIDYAERHLILRDHPNALLWRARDDADDMLKCYPDGVAGAALDGERPFGDNVTLYWRTAQRTLDKSLKALYKPNEGALAAIGCTKNGQVPRVDELSASQLRPGEAHSVYHRLPPHNVDQAQVQARTCDVSPSSDKMVHSTYARVLEHGSRVVGCDADVLADTVYALEVRMIKMIHYHRAQRKALQDDEEKMEKAQMKDSQQ